MSELQKSFEERRDDGDCSDLEGRINFVDGSPDFKCGYCGGVVGDGESSVVRKFEETAGKTKRLYHSSCADEYAVDLKWVRMSFEKKASLLCDAKEYLAVAEKKYLSACDLSAQYESKKVLSLDFLLKTVIPFYSAISVFRNNSDESIKGDGCVYGFLDAVCTGLAACVGVASLPSNPEGAAMLYGAYLFYKCVFNYSIEKSIRNYAKQDMGKSQLAFESAKENLLVLEERIKRYEDYSPVGKK